MSIKLRLIFFVMTCFVQITTVWAQDDLLSSFDIAKSLYNQKKYKESITEIEKIERKLGGTNPPLLRLKVLNQDKLLNITEEEFYTDTYNFFLFKEYTENIQKFEKMVFDFPQLGYLLKEMDNQLKNRNKFVAELPRYQLVSKGYVEEKQRREAILAQQKENQRLKINSRVVHFGLHYEMAINPYQSNSFGFLIGNENTIFQIGLGRFYRFTESLESEDYDEGNFKMLKYTERAQVDEQLRDQEFYFGMMKSIKIKSLDRYGFRPILGARIASEWNYSFSYLQNGSPVDPEKIQRIQEIGIDPKILYNPQVKYNRQLTYDLTLGVKYRLGWINFIASHSVLNSSGVFFGIYFNCDYNER